VAERRETDPLAGLVALPGVADSIVAARAAVDALLWDRAVGTRRAEVAAESALRGAWANAWFEGAETGLAQLRTGAALDASPVGRLLGNTTALHAELPVLVDVVGMAPAQALARMHALVAHGFVPDDELGRPRASGEADDALRLGAPPGPGEVAERMAGLGRLLVASAVPGVLVASIAHAEVAVVRPFGWGSGLVARALLRLVLAQRGVDPEMLAAPEVGLRSLGRPAYVRAMRAYRTGSADGVSALVDHLTRGIAAGARAPVTWLAEPPLG